MVSDAGVDWSTAVFRLERTPCYGTCPWYQVSIYPDNRVEYEGRQYVGQCGKQVAWAEAPGHAGLISAFRAARYLSMQLDTDRDGISVTDQDSARTLVEVSGRHRTILHYGPRSSWLQLTELEDLIDTVGGTRRWTRCEGEACFCGSSKDTDETVLLHWEGDAGVE